MDDFSMYVPNVHFEQIPIRNLVSNQEYQRNLSRSHIARAAASFNLYQINPVKVSRRDGINYVFNGQHTIEIVALTSGSRETPVWCMVYDDLSYEHEADIFANQMKFVKPLNPYEVFMANIEAGNDDQLIIRDLVESYGLSMPYFSPIKAAAISADNAAGKYANAAGVFPRFLPAPEFFLYHFVYLRSDYGGMAVFNIVLRYFALIYFPLFSQKVDCKAFLCRRGYWAESNPHHKPL